MHKKAKASDFAYAGADLTEPKQQYRRHHIYPICWMPYQPKSTWMKEIAAQTKALSAVNRKCCAACCLVALEHATYKKNDRCEIRQIFTTEVFPVCTE